MTEEKLFSITDILDSYCPILKSTTSRSEALKNVADQATLDFGDFITPGSLNLKDETEINFAELLDQTIYEFRENTDLEANIKDYIIDDLYSRLYLYLESFNSLEMYIRNIKNRPIFHDDCIIIRNKKIARLIPLLIEEYDELTILQKPVIKTLLHLSDETPADFFLRSFNDSSHGFIKSAAMLGLKYKGELNLQKLNSDDMSKSCTLPYYADNFNTSAIWKNKEPANKEEITFVLLHIEKNIKIFNDYRSVEWILDTINLIPGMNFGNSWLNEINTSMSNILLNMDIGLIKEFLNNDERLLMTINFIDLFPKNIFNRLTGRLDELGLEFHYRLNTILEKNEFKPGDINSNMLNYLSWNTR